MTINHTNPTQHITVGKKDVWEPILPCPPNIQSNIWNSAFEDAAGKLIEKQMGNANAERGKIEFAVEGEVTISQDIAGLHVIPHDAKATYQFKVMLKEDSSVKAQAVFTCSTGGATLSSEG